jgi:hypothetical protein
MTIATMADVGYICTLKNRRAKKKRKEDVVYK